MKKYNYKRLNYLAVGIVASFSFFLGIRNIAFAQPIPINVPEPTPTASPQSTETTPNPQSVGSLNVTPTTLLQTGSNNFANVNSSNGTLNYPNCSGTCAFAILRTSPSNNLNGNISNQIEAVIGVIFALDSPEKANAETNRLMVEIQKNRSEFEIMQTLGEKLADAIEAGLTERANIISMMLAPRLGKTYTQLLTEIRSKR